MKPSRYVPSTPEFRAAFKEWHGAQADHAAAYARLRGAGTAMSPRLEALIVDVQVKGAAADRALMNVYQAATTARP